MLPLHPNALGLEPEEAATRHDNHDKKGAHVARGLQRGGGRRGQPQQQQQCLQQDQELLLLIFAQRDEFVTEVADLDSGLEKGQKQ